MMEMILPKEYSTMCPYCFEITIRESQEKADRSVKSHKGRCLFKDNPKSLPTHYASHGPTAHNSYAGKCFDGYNWEYQHESNEEVDENQFESNGEFDEAHIRDEETSDISHLPVLSTIMDASYIKAQEHIYRVTYGMKAISARSLAEFVLKTKQEHPDEWISFHMKALIFGERIHLSRSKGKEYVEMLNALVKMFEKKANISIPKARFESWRVFQHSLNRNMKEMTYLEVPIEWSNELQMDKWNPKQSKSVPEKLILRVRNPLTLLALKLVDPKIIFGCEKHVQFKTKKIYTDDPNTAKERLLADYMSTDIAILNEEFIINREICRRADNPNKADVPIENVLIAPLHLHCDGVVMDDGGRAHSNTVLGTTGLFSDELQRRAFAKFCIGYIPTVKDISEAAFMNHLLHTLKHSAAEAKRILSRFFYSVEQQFWSLVLEPINKAWEEGIYLRILGKSEQLVKVFPYVVSIVGDEPAQKQITGCMSGDCRLHCVSCTYCLKSGRPYNSLLDLPRDVVQTQALIEEAIIDRENKFSKSVVENTKSKKQNKKVKKVKKSEKPLTAAQKLHLLSIHPYRNVWHNAALGLNNNIYKCAVQDLFHIFCAGLLKSACRAAIQIIVAFNANKNDKRFYNKSSSTFNARIRKYPNNVASLPHVPKGASFTFDLTKIVSLETNKEKSSAVGSGGGLRSSWWVSIALQIIFAIGDSNDIVPNDKKYRFTKTFNKKVGKNNEEDPEASEGKTETKSVILVSVAKKIVNCLYSLLDFYFQAKRASFTSSQIDTMRRCAASVTAYFQLLHETKQAVIFMQGILKVRKIHYIHHLADAAATHGCLSKNNTESYETAEKTYTNEIWEETSKRYVTLIREMTNKVGRRDLVESISQLSGILEHGVDYIKTNGIQCGPEHNMFERISHCRSSKLRRSEETGLFCIQHSTKYKTQFRETLDMRLRHGSLSVSILTDIINNQIGEFLITNKKKPGYSEDIKVALIDGIKFIGSEDSAVGEGFVYATPRMLGTQAPRYDFILIATKDHSTYIGQVLAFIEISSESNKDRVVNVTAVVQPLVKSNVQTFLFPQYQWHEVGNVGNFPLECIDIEEINGAAHMVPFLSLNVINHYPKTSDRFYFIERQFTDRSGWHSNPLVNNDLFLGDSNILQFLQNEQSSSEGITQSGVLNALTDDQGEVDSDDEVVGEEEDDDDEEEDEEEEMGEGEEEGEEGSAMMGRGGRKRRKIE